MFARSNRSRDAVTPQGAPTREDDIRIAALAAAGDRTAQRQIVVSLLGKVRSIIAYSVNDPIATEDLTQTAMLKVLISLKDYRGESTLAFWATRIAVRMATRAIKTKKRRQQLLFFLPEPTSPFTGVEARATQAEMRWHINHLVSKLSAKQQMAIRLRYVHEYNIKEISEITNVSENTVRDRLRVGKKKLKRLLVKNPAVRAGLFEVNE